MGQVDQNKGGGPERRRQPRKRAKEPMGVSRIVPALPVSDAEILNISANGVAIRTRVALKPGMRRSFSTGSGRPPVLAEVLATETEADGSFRVRCRCLLGGFEV
jgi:hypothetical protein